jgi:hypothetical protein
MRTLKNGVARVWLGEGSARGMVGWVVGTWGWWGHWEAGFGRWKVGGVGPVGGRRCGAGGRWEVGWVEDGGGWGQW